MPQAGLPVRGAGRKLRRMALPEAVSLGYVEAGRGETVVFLHGGMGDCLSWEPQLTAISPRFHVVSYSRRYHFPNANFFSSFRHSWRDETRDLGDFLRLLGCGPAHLVGTSYGALTALAFALGQPARVRSLVLIEPPLPSWVAAERESATVCDVFMREVWGQAKERFRQGRQDLAMQVLFDGMRGGDAFDSLSETQREGIMRNASAMEMLVCSNDSFPDFDATRVATLQMPILLVNGHDTVPFHQYAHRALVRVLPRARQEVIEGAGHAPAMENAGQFNSIALHFLMSSRQHHYTCR